MPYSLYDFLRPEYQQKRLLFFLQEFRLFLVHLNNANTQDSSSNLPPQQASVESQGHIPFSLGAPHPDQDCGLWIQRSAGDHVEITLEPTLALGKSSLRWRQLIV